MAPTLINKMILVIERIPAADASALDGGGYSPNEGSIRSRHCPIAAILSPTAAFRTREKPSGPGYVLSSNGLFE
jgi:hypothetical protein